MKQTSAITSLIFFLNRQIDKVLDSGLGRTFEAGDSVNPRLVFKIVLIFSISLLFSGCYLLKQGVYLFRYTSGAKSTHRMLKNEKLDEKTRNFIALVDKIRAFARDSIGLAENKSYTKYVYVNKDHLVDVVTAAEELSFTQYKWCFPFFGCFPNKGFFERKDADIEAGKLKKKGYDVIIDEVDAFSTLGILSDPLYSFMEEFSTYELASVILHELTHATVFVKSQLQFNEELATYIGTEGALKFIKENDTTGAYNRVIAYLEDRDVYLNMLRQLYRDLGTVYTTEKDTLQARKAKKELIDGFKQNIASNYTTLFKTKGFKGVPGITINNAHLAIRMTYSLDLKMYDRYRNVSGYTLKQFVGYAKSFKKEKDPKSKLRKDLDMKLASQGKSQP
ncbi:MAG TPA: aminopeptidase [Chitinispirillaceae bacterium]|nr:aminopeptidase [Chitinispirillaceae bacterium]